MSAATAPVRLILMDIDGTLVGRNGIHPSTWQAFDEARARGVRLGLCTGRIGRGRALELAREVAPHDFHVFQSGAVVTRPDEPAAHCSTVPDEALHALVAISRRTRTPLEAYSEDRFLLEWHSELTRVHEAHIEITSELVDLLAVEVPVVRAQWVVHESEWPRYRAWTEALGGLDINPATAPWSPGTIFANLTRAGTNKASGLRWLATHLGLSTDEVMMIGDAENDLAALDAAGVAVVVDSAPDLVKAHADRIVASPDDGGIAQAIRGALTSRA